MRNVIKKCSFYRKKLRILPMLISIVIFIGCEKNDALDSVKKPSNASLKSAGTTEPYLTGTFIDFWDGKAFIENGWTIDKWRKYMVEMRNIGIKTLVVQQTIFNNQDFFKGYKQPLGKLLNAASENGIEVIIGLQFNENFEKFENGKWKNTSDLTFLKTQAETCTKLMSDIWADYGNDYSATIAGWYIPYEPAPAYYKNVQGGVDVFIENLIEPIAKVRDNICSDKLISIAPFVNTKNNTKPEDLLNFMDKLAASNLDVIMLQDGTGSADENGVPHVSKDQIGLFFEKAKDGLFNHQNKFQGELWSDIEIFSYNSNHCNECNNNNNECITDFPETYGEVKNKLLVVSNFVTKNIAFQYHRYASKTTNRDDKICPPFLTSAKKLQEEWKKDYINWP